MSALGCDFNRSMQHLISKYREEDSEVVDVFLQARRDGRAATRFFKRLLKVNGREPRKIVTDNLRSYGVAHRELMPDTIHDTSQYANNRAELSHQPTRARHASLQIDKSGPTVSEYTRRSVQPVQFGSTLDIGQSLSAIQTTRLCVLELRNGLITESTLGGFSCSDINLSIPVGELLTKKCSIRYSCPVLSVV